MLGKNVFLQSRHRVGVRVGVGVIHSCIKSDGFQAMPSQTRGANMQVRFAIDSKQEDGAQLPGSSKMWVTTEKAAAARKLLRCLLGCIEIVQLPLTHKERLFKFLGAGKGPHHIQCHVTRENFDLLMAELLSLTRAPIPANLSWVFLAVRHSLPRESMHQPQGLTIVCLFPISAQVSRRVMDTHYQFDGGWRTDGLFLWLGQEQRKGHLEVVRALEDCCNSYQAVLIFTRTSQGSQHTFIGRARGFLPIAEQQVEQRQPFRAAIMVDSVGPFRMTDNVLYPGDLIGAKQGATKGDVHAALGLNPPRHYSSRGYSVSSVAGQCNVIHSPLGVLMNSLESK